ncbi:REP-associated tyrosine transposase [Nostoc sp. MS1]|uniref:REP-associated tyrosine transposase n=1 Tax=Nostoc sp. MS1 TaxID=2764711 RepID=UPI001CC33889|nr:transposase [Nostoc sp. MS1]BCL33740.1 transposase [Nostoc sp. MS1]
MPNYRRAKLAGGTYFLTQVTHHRQPWLITDIARLALRTAITHVRQKYPFTIDAFVLLPDHFHCIWTLPPGDSDLSTRLRLIKTFVTKNYKNQLEIHTEISASRQKRQERNLWQRRFWEHLIRDERDFVIHCDYIHYNPVRHKLCQIPQDWQFSTIHRFISQGIYPLKWGKSEVPEMPNTIWDI